MGKRIKTMIKSKSKNRKPMVGSTHNPPQVRWLQVVNAKTPFAPANGVFDVNCKLSSTVHPRLGRFG